MLRLVPVALESKPKPSGVEAMARILAAVSLQAWLDNWGRDAAGCDVTCALVLVFLPVVSGRPADPARVGSPPHMG